MTKPFFTRLEQYFSDVSDVLKGTSSKSAIFPNPSDIGDSREDIFAQVLRDHLPANCTVRKGGFLFGLNGDESKQIDIMINSSSSLQFNFSQSGKTFSCVDGCLGVVSVKSNLSRENLIDAINNLASIPTKSDITPNTNPMFKINNYTDWPYKVIFAAKGASCELILSTLNTYCTEQGIPENLRPNCVYVAGSYYIQNTGYKERETRDGDTLPAYTYTALNDPSNADKLAIPNIILDLHGNALAANQIIYKYGNLVDNMC